MTHFPVFLSVVLIVRNQAEHLANILTDAVEKLTPLVSDYELIVVDNASQDDSISALKRLTSETGLPNLQIYALTKEVDTDTASWVGFENALGDFVAIIDPLLDDIAFLPQMLDKAVSGADVVFASNEEKPKQNLLYRGAFAIFNKLYQRFSGIYLATEAPQYRLLSKRVINFILQHPQPAISYRHLPATSRTTTTITDSSVALRGLSHSEELSTQLTEFIHTAHDLTPTPTNFNELALLMAYLNTSLSGIVIGPRNTAQLDSTMLYWQRLQKETGNISTTTLNKFNTLTLNLQAMTKR